MPQIDTEKLEAYAQMIFERENQFNTYTLETIARRIKATGQLSAHDQKALKNIADISDDMDKITKELARITEMNIDDIEKIYAQVINDGVNSYKPLYDLKGMEFKPIIENDYAMKLVRHWAELTNEKMINLSHTKALGFVDDNGNFTQLAGAYQQTIDDAVVAVSTGTTDFNSAMKGTIERLGGSGVQTWYGSGVHRSLEAMVRQNLLWGAKKAAQRYDDYVSEELGLDGFEVDAHAGCRPSHEFMQGKMYAYDGDKVINGVKYEDGSRALSALEDYNCLHFKTGVMLGVSEPRYSQKELNRIHRETTEKIKYNGREKTLYEWKQTQRRLEREYRKAKTQSDMFKASGNNIAAKDYRDKANAIRAAYDDLTAKVPGLYDHSDRMRTYFTGAKSLTSGGSGGIMSTKILNDKVQNPMNEDRYRKMRHSLEKQGVTFVEATGGDDLRYLLARGAEATYIDGQIMHIGEIPSASAFFEEIIHKTQEKKYGKLLFDDYLERDAREVAANRMLLKYGKQYGFDETDYNDIRLNLEKWEKSFKNRTGVDYEESNYKRDI